MHSYPEDTVATIEDFKSSRWKIAVFAEPGQAVYPAVWDRLSNTARDALAEGKSAESKVLWLLADACSMMLKPKKH
jgi:hypothetical protein